MPVTFHIPGPLRVYCAGLGRVEIAASPKNVREAFEALFAQYPGVRDRLVNEEGQLREHINIFVGTENIRYTGGFASPLHSGREISIIPAVSGGSRSRREFSESRGTAFRHQQG